MASRIDDCSLWQAMWLAPDAVRRHPAGEAAVAPLSWTELMAEGKGTPPYAPIAAWASRTAVGHWSNYSWSWSPQWVAAAGQALAHLLVASQGQPVIVPDGLVGEVFQRTLDAMLPARPQARRAVLAGPGRPAPDEGADILLVPSHPRTGEVWAPDASAAYLVPLPFGVWLRMLLPESGLPGPAPLPVSGGLPDGVLRDDFDWPACRPRHTFEVDWAVFQHTLVRLPAVRSPWLRDVVESFRRGC
nr:hypothetical protein [Streptomyces antimicrobicus]